MTVYQLRYLDYDGSTCLGIYSSQGAAREALSLNRKKWMKEHAITASEMDNEIWMTEHVIDSNGEELWLEKNVGRVKLDGAAR